MNDNLSPQASLATDGRAPSENFGSASFGCEHRAARITPVHDEMFGAGSQATWLIAEVNDIGQFEAVLFGS
jgi:hypothetical protein